MEATEEHPFWVPDKGWVQAKDLKESDEFVDLDGNIRSIDSIKVRSTTGTEIFNISVYKNHNYFVTDKNILTHNKNCEYLKNLFDKNGNVVGNLDAFLAAIKRGDVSPEEAKQAMDYLKEYGKNGADEAIDSIKKAAKGTSNLTDLAKGYVDDILVDGVVDANKMNDLRLALQKGTFSADEIKQISKHMNDIGATEAFETAMKNVDFGKYLRTIAGDPPVDMVNPHAHHILFKTGLGDAQKALVQEGQDILRKHGIDPIVGAENLVWAPNAVTGQHDLAAITKVVDTLKAVDDAGGDYDDIVEALQKLGSIASQR